MEVKIFRCDYNVISATEWQISFRRDVYSISDKEFSLVAEAIKVKTGGAFSVILQDSTIAIKKVGDIPDSDSYSLQSMGAVREEILNELVASCELLPDYDSRHFYEKYCKPAKKP